MLFRSIDEFPLTWGPVLVQKLIDLRLHGVDLPHPHLHAAPRTQERVSSEYLPCQLPPVPAVGAALHEVGFYDIGRSQLLHLLAFAAGGGGVEDQSSAGNP